MDLPLVGGGTARGLARQPFARYQPEDRLEDVERLGTFPEANYEQIASVQPDCIIDSTTNDREQYERLSQIAPTFNFNEILYGEGSLADWPRALKSVAKVFGRGNVAEQVLSDYEERAADLRARLAERWAGATFAVVGGGEPGTLNINYLNSQPLLILSEELSLAPAEFVPETYEEYLEEGRLSLERIDLLQEVDLLFVRVEVSQAGPGRDRGVVAPMLESPLWKRLPAVRAGQVHEFDAELFYASPLTATAFLDAVENSLLS
ncbi:MAG: ABC transporter substrate-binding protein [Rubrobacter sp.]|nr:ABC transporter substrate-binding protein [Rubrobacter sp.]